MWKCQGKVPYKFVSVQLFKNPVRQFLPFLFYFELSPLLLAEKKYNTNPTINDEGRKYWKVKIERVNNEDNTNVMELTKNDEQYKEIIEAETEKVIKVIERTSKSQVILIRLIYIIKGIFQ